MKTDKPPARVETETKITDPFVATVEPVVKEAEKSKAPGRVDAVSPAEMAGREEKPDVNTEVSHPKARHAVPDPDPLTILESLVEGGNLSAALRRFAAQKIEDGAYYALYARCYYESGEWEKAYETAEISTRVPSRRISPNSRKGQFLLYKAKWFSVRFDRSPTHEGAQEAIAAWWDVRQHFDGTAESAKASFAESEIGRLSSVFSE